MVKSRGGATEKVWIAGSLGEEMDVRRVNEASEICVEDERVRRWGDRRRGQMSWRRLRKACVLADEGWDC